MSARIMLDYPRQYLVRRLWRRIVALAGALLLVVGIAASIAVVPSSLLAIGWFLDEQIDIEIRPGRTLSADEILLAWIASTMFAVVGLRRGLRFVRGERTLVLFLRRFGYDDATNAVTFAVTRTIGSSWRLVTLDDAEIAPLGVPTGTKWLFGTVQLAWRLVLRTGELLLRAFPVAQLAMWGILAVDLARSRIWERAQNPEAWMTILAPYLDIVFATVDGRLPIDTLGFTPHGAFALMAIVVAGIVMALGAVVTAVPLAWLLSAGLFLFVFSVSGNAVREAERLKARDVRTPEELDAAVQAVVDKSRKVFGPRLVVLRVASSLWQKAVGRLASVSHVLLIDVSEPTENLIWEIEQLTIRSTFRCVFICQHDRAVQMTAGAGASGPAGLDPTMVRLFEEQEILAYTTDRRGRRRFARALRSRLLSLSA